jgi:predicted RNA-binding protein
MAILIGGIVSIALGVLLGVLWWSPVLSLLGGGLPVLFILGGGIAIYLGIDELRYPASKAFPAAEPEREPAVKGAVAPAEPDRGKRPRYWLLGYSAHNVDLVRGHGMIAVPAGRAEIIEQMMGIGDRVVLYALSPDSKFGGIVEVASDCTRSSEMPFVPAKKGEIWEYQREVKTVVLPSADQWIDAKPLLEKLDLLQEARKAGKNLARSFAAKLREMPQISAEDYDRIAKAMGA